MLVISRSREHIATLTKELVTQIQIIVVAVLQIGITSNLSRPVRFLIEERSHLDKRRTGYRTGERKTKAVLPVKLVTEIHGREQVVAVQLATLHLTAVFGIIHPLATVLVTDTHVHQQGIYRIDIGQNIAGINLVSGGIAAFGLLRTRNGYLSAGDGFLIQEVGRRIHRLFAPDHGIQLVQVIVETSRSIVAGLILVRKTCLQLILCSELIFTRQAADPLLLVQRTKVTHRFLTVQLEKIDFASFTHKHNLPPVGFVARSLAIRTAPVQAPAIAEKMLAVQLMILKCIDMCHIITAYQVMVFVVVTLTVHIVVYRITGIEEGIVHLILLTEAVT